MPHTPAPSHNHLAVTSSQSPDWGTPRWLYDVLDAEFSFALDAASNDRHHQTAWLGPGSDICEDGLAVPWAPIVLYLNERYVDRPPAIFCNPPYSQRDRMPISPWVEQMASAGETVTVVGVLPYAPQTKWWRQFVWGSVYRATEIRLFPYRIKFDPPPDYVGDAPGANVNTAIVIWRPSHLFVDPWVPQVRYWDPKPARVKNDDADADAF